MRCAKLFTMGNGKSEHMLHEPRRVFLWLLCGDSAEYLCRADFSQHCVANTPWVGAKQRPPECNDTGCGAGNVIVNDLGDACWETVLGSIWVCLLHGFTIAM